MFNVVGGVKENERENKSGLGRLVSYSIVLFVMFAQE
jgi:hypothetical protein